MNKKIFENARFCPKGDTEANWNKAVGFVPLDKEIIIYKADAEHPVARFKIGDGKTGVQELPFAGADMAAIEKLIDEKGELLIEYVDNAVAAIKFSQVDYNQNDPAAADYIKNRPFYEEETIVTKELINESISEDVHEWSVDTGFSEKDIFDITLNGVEYSGLACRISEGDGYCYGNLALIELGDDTGEPFVFVCGIYEGTSICGIMTTIDVAGGVPIIITRHGVDINIKQLDEKYIPDSIARVEDLDRQQKEIDGKVVIAAFNITEANTTIDLNSLEGVTQIDWGDDVINNRLSHNYANTGTYKCKIYGVTSIGYRALSFCYNLTSVVIGDSVTSIGYQAFYKCTSLTSVVIPDSVTSIDDGAFYDCSSLTSIEIPDSVTTIGNEAFSTCISLMSVVIGNGVTSIGNGVFSSCVSLTSVDIPDSVTSIGDTAFYNCRSLTSVSIPDNVTSIGNYAFAECESLTEITLPFVGNTKDGTSNAHFGYIFGASSYFNNNDYVPTSLKKVTITSATSIGERAFSSCSSLTSVEIGDSVTSIGNSAFSSCSSLTSVVIGDNVTTIGLGAFGGCSSLMSVRFKKLTPINYNDAWFIGCASLAYIYVPYGCKQAYIDKWAADGATQVIFKKIVEFDREAMMSDLEVKYDKTGGTINGDVSIQGNLTVIGTTTTKDTETVMVKDNTIVANSDGIELLEEAGFAIKTNTTDTYGIMYDPIGDGVKIGLGGFDENGKFIYADGEAQFLATRADTLIHGNFPQWDNEKKQFVDSGKKIGNFLTKPASNGVVRFNAADGTTSVYPTYQSVPPTAGNAIPVCKAKGRLVVGTPEADDEATPKKYVNDGFVAKKTNVSQNNQVYVKTSAGENTLFDITAATTANTIPCRDGNGDIIVLDIPKTNTSAASKWYVDMKADSVKDAAVIQIRPQIPTFVDEALSAIPQIDYNQNDTQSRSYIKNRPCYSYVQEVVPTQEIVPNLQKDLYDMQMEAETQGAGDNNFQTFSEAPFYYFLLEDLNYIGIEDFPEDTILRLGTFGYYMTDNGLSFGMTSSKDVLLKDFPHYLQRAYWYRMEIYEDPYFGQIQQMVAGDSGWYAYKPSTGETSGTEVLAVILPAQYEERVVELDVKYVPYVQALESRIEELEKIITRIAQDNSSIGSSDSEITRSDLVPVRTTNVTSGSEQETNAIISTANTILPEAGITESDVKQIAVSTWDQAASSISDIISKTSDGLYKIKEYLLNIKCGKDLISNVQLTAVKDTNDWYIFTLSGTIVGKNFSVSATAKDLTSDILKALVIALVKKYTAGLLG